MFHSHDYENRDQNGRVTGWLIHFTPPFRVNGRLLSDRLFTFHTHRWPLFSYNRLIVVVCELFFALLFIWILGAGLAWEGKKFTLDWSGLSSQVHWYLQKSWKMFNGSRYLDMLDEFEMNVNCDFHAKSWLLSLLTFILNVPLAFLAQPVLIWIGKHLYSSMFFKLLISISHTSKKYIFVYLNKKVSCKLLK